MRVDFEAEVIEWRGPAPFLFAPLPPDALEQFVDLVGVISYGWGCIAVTARIGGSVFTTSLMPRDGGYLLPVKVAVQRAEGIAVGDPVRARLDLPDGPPGT